MAAACASEKPAVYTSDEERAAVKACVKPGKDRVTYSDIFVANVTQRERSLAMAWYYRNTPPSYDGSYDETAAALRGIESQLTLLNIELH